MLWLSRWVGWGRGAREALKGEDTRLHIVIHVVVQQKLMQYCKAKILQLKKKNPTHPSKSSSRLTSWCNSWCPLNSHHHLDPHFGTWLLMHHIVKACRSLPRLVSSPETGHSALDPFISCIWYSTGLSKSSWNGDSHRVILTFSMAQMLHQTWVLPVWLHANKQKSVNGKIFLTCVNR